MTLVVVDSSGQELEDGQRIETASAPLATESSSAGDVGPSLDLPGAGNSGDPLVVRADVGQSIGSAGGGLDGPADSPASISANGITGLVDGSARLPGQGPAPAGAAGESTAGTAAESTAGTAAQTTAGTAAETTAGTAAQTTAGTAAESTAGTAAETTAGTAAKSNTTGAAAAPTTAAPTTKAPTTAAPTTSPPAAPASKGTEAQFEAIRNRDPLFNRYENVPASQISMDALTIPAPVPDNGAHPDGNFRMACNYSHFSYDDPIVFPGQPGKSHLHMFFGNTKVNAHTTTNSLVNSGGGSCNGFELNRSGYWTPALLDGKGNAVVPDQIILYYKTKHPGEVQRMPQGLKMIAGNPTKESFTADYKLGWSCGPSGTSYNKSNRIPNNCGSDPVNFYIQFPFCWDGKNLDAPDHSSHMTYVNDNQSCPGSHPVRLPQISILVYFPAGNTNGWYLSSDRSNGFNTGPGATLHADWFGGWNDDAMDLWINGCMKRARNCSYGQTGTARMFARLNPLQTYQGNNFLPLP